MAQYEKIFEKPYEDGYADLPSQNTPITAQTLNDKDAAIEHIEDFLDGQEFPTAEEKAVWDDAQNLYQYTLLNQVAQINSNTQGIVLPIALNDYSVGDLFIQQKKLCKAITPIANGDELIKNTNYIEVNVGDELGLKADISAIGTDESGRTTASRAYAYGERFYKDGKFCRVISTSGVAQGTTWTLSTNYEESDIAADLRNTITQVSPAAGITFGINKVTRKGYTVQVLLRLTTPASTSGTTTLGSVPYLPANADFAFLQYMHQNAPYTPLGNIFIRQSSGEVVLPQDAPANTGIFVFGTYICQ